ncbi:MULTISPECIES: DEAD/DEAH box helicase [Methanosarcina]|uniref:Helicase n=1 Tax=Methanosarcina vacuolata Z-761 TaxID=1434123 RepID=A0A0E3LGL6_9EURY|nr:MULTISPECIES: DEAD/DEAH box helicase [Methanosarcina]AKB42736.1 hypothetical protein MSVAZ_0467 [Methanosarcina vacuolata Z-761]MCC4765797.1 DEAD/DEAH box helicase [Methanosarcina sp. DH1]
MSEASPKLIDEIIDQIRNSESIGLEESFQFAKDCSELLRGNESEQQYGRKVIINILDNCGKLESSTYDIWADLVEAAGFYPYLEKEKCILQIKNTGEKIRKEFHFCYDLDKYFHEQQKALSELLRSDKNVIVSAPTSFGKSLLIEEIVASKRYKNIVVIQPTLALLDETRRKLFKYTKDYRIIIRTSQKYVEEGRNLFLLTAERVMEYQNLPNIDFFIIDEFYKLSARRDDERSDILNNAFNLLVNKHKSRFYLLGPNIEGISEGFTEKYNAKFFKTNYGLVDCVTVDCYSEKFGERGKKGLLKEKELFELLLKLRDEQSLIYCASPNRARSLSKKFQEYLVRKEVIFPEKRLSIIEWLKENINEQWDFIDCLKYGIGIHDGALPKHITATVIKYFNEKKLNYLFCTTTIIEGVNTSAKNVIFFDSHKGNKKSIDFFDYSNIKGRAGRMMEHYVGRIYNFNKPIAEEKIIIDIPFFEQNPVSDEILVQINDKDIKYKNTNQYKELKNLPLEEKELFKKNGVSIKGQKQILDFLMENINQCYSLIYWKGYPTYEQLRFTISLAWAFLLKSGESGSPMTSKKLVKVTYDYGLHQNMNYLIKSEFTYLASTNKNKTKNEILNAAIQNQFQIQRHWLHYKVPKWLNVINELQKYVCEKKALDPGNYLYYATQIENDFIPDHLSILAEYGVPTSAINKLKSKVPNEIPEDQLLETIVKNSFYKVNLLEYEKEKLLENFT